MSTLQGEYLTKLCKIYGYLKKIETQRPKKKKVNIFFRASPVKILSGFRKGAALRPFCLFSAYFLCQGSHFRALK